VTRGLFAALLLISSTARADPTTVAREVAAIRGLPIKKKIEQEIVARDELRARLIKLAGDRKTQDEMKAEGFALARWGLIPLDTDYVQLMVDLLTEQIAGYYDPETKKLTLLSTTGADPVWDDMVLAHEIDHALQDQSYDLDAFEKLPVGEGDASQARHALVEGDGIVLMLEVLLARKALAPPWGNPQIAAELGKAMELPTGDSLDRAPLAIREQMLFPYRAGFAFVAALRAQKPWSGVDAAYKRPPRSTEQILHPEKYLTDEKPLAVPAPAAPEGYVQVHSTVWGELGFELFLRAHGADPATAKLAAAGWGGDRVTTVARTGETRPARAIGIATFEWDSEADAIEAFDAAERALDTSAVSATAEHSDTRTRWLNLDGTITQIERRGTQLQIVLGAPLAGAL
jgi:hypothetical protein